MIQPCVTEPTTSASTDSTRRASSSSESVISHVLPIGIDRDQENRFSFRSRTASYAGVYQTPLRTSSERREQPSEGPSP